MKKAIVVFTVIFCSYVCCAQQILRLNQEEIKANETPQAVAYNFVKSIIFEDYANAVELMSLDYFFELMPTLFVEQVPIDRLFSSEYTHKIVDMRPVVNLGYEVAITETQLLDPNEFFDEDSKYRAEPAYFISFCCADDKGHLYDGKHGKYDTDVKVMIVREDDVWKVNGFE